MRCLTLKNIASAVKGELYNAETDSGHEVDGVVIDSRKIAKNYLFVAIKGERADGHDFLRQVFADGAAAAIVEQKPDDDITAPYILVESTTEALRRLAEYYRSVLDIKVVGITGSVGKTSTKEFIASVLSEHYSVLKTAGNFNNEIGLPLTVFNIREEHQVAVLEMGISDFGEMTRLSKIAKPDICVITNIGLCHLENLGTRDGILKAKTEMLANANEHFRIVLNGDDDKLSQLKPFNENEICFYGIGHKNRVYADNIESLGIEGSQCDIVTPEGSIRVRISVPGRHMIYNAAAAATVGLIMSLTPDEIKSGIEKLKDVGGRLNIIKNDFLTLIDDCYNANPVSAKASLDVLEYGKGRRMAVLGDMFELGVNEKELHRQVGAYLAEKDIEAAVFIGALSKNTYNGAVENGYKGNVWYFENIEDFFKKKDDIIKNGDTILVKASHSMHFEKIVEALR